MVGFFIPHYFLSAKTMSEILSEQIDLSRHLIKKGPKFRSHTIVFGDTKARLKPTIPALLFCLNYVVVGVFLLVLAAIVYHNTRQVDLVIFLYATGTAISIFGVTLLQPFLKRISFDKTTGVFANNADRPLKLENITSLQITNKMITSKQGISYPCYELNALTKYGRRLNILNHNDLQQMEIDGEQLSKFLDVELLDRKKEIIL